MTTVYLLRHSESFRELEGIYNTKDSILLINEKNPLSVNGEKLAEKVASNPEFNNIDTVWSSNYVRAMSTAKYFAVNNGLKVNIDYRLGERIQGITSWDQLPPGFELKQFEDETYKIGFGENQLDVRKRMEEVFNEILAANKDKRIVIVSHATAILFLLMRWCKIERVDDQFKISLDGKNMFNIKSFKFCETFKLTFDENNLVDIENISY